MGRAVMQTNQAGCDEKAGQVSRLACEILGYEYLILQTQSLKLMENFETNHAKLEAKIVEIAKNKPHKRTIQGEGVGLIDACFDGMIKAYEPEYVSLDAIRLIDFSLNTKAESQSKRRSDANVTAMLRVNNSENYEFTFFRTTSSISHSSVEVVQDMVAFFINSELAYVAMYRALENAKGRGRSDLIERYQNQMATLVQATSYKAVVEKLRSKNDL
jgi:hypothetical protein